MIMLAILEIILAVILEITKLEILENDNDIDIRKW